ncbi:anti-sigma regulatory factor [Desulfobacterales bacterium HSG16]|nr:anti-sigma regulatory factor [Desulfobacterales bacterium HSG16]
MPEGKNRATRIDIEQESSIYKASEAARKIASKLGFDNIKQCKIATAVSELATNIHRYAGSGFILIRIIDIGSRQGVEIIAEDIGPGIADLKSALMDNFSTSAGSLGIGLPGTQRMMDEFEIESKTGKGTLVKIREWL